MEDLGNQSRWLNGYPAIIQVSPDNITLGDQSRWLNGYPSIIQFQQTVFITLTYDELIVPSAPTTLIYDELNVPASPAILTSDFLDVPAIVPLAASLQWTAYAVQDIFPALAWTSTGLNKCTPNLINYPFYTNTPTISSFVCPLAFSGCFPGFTIYLANTGSSGQTVIEIYAGGILRHTENILATGLEFQTVQYLTMDFLLHPYQQFSAIVTSVATGASDLKVDLYEMTFPFALDISSFGNKQGGISYTGNNRKHLFLNADSWYIDLNQPILSIDYVKVLDKHGQELPLTGTLETGDFYQNRISFSPYTAGITDRIRIRVQDIFRVYHVLEIGTVVSPYSSDLPNMGSYRISASSYSSDITGSGTASATGGGTNPPNQAVDNISNNTSYWLSGISTFPISWGYDLGVGQEKIITAINMKPFKNSSGSAIKDFKIWGSNVISPSLSTDGDWIMLFVGQTTNISEFQLFEWENSAAYRHYRISIDSNYRSTIDGGIDELEFFITSDVYTSNIIADCFIGAKKYRYSFDNGSSWTSWINITDTQKLELDFTGKSTATYPMQIQYKLGDNTIQDSLNILFINDPLDASVQFFGENAILNYFDIIPFNRVEVYYDDILEKTVVPVIFSGFTAASTDYSLGTITIDSGSIYYNNQKYDFDGSSHTVDPDFSNHQLTWRAIFGFNTSSNIFEFLEEYNETPGQGIIELIDNFIPLWVFDYVLLPVDAAFSSFTVQSISNGISNIPQAIIPIEVSENRKIVLHIFDISNRYLRATETFIKTKYNLWKTLIVTAKNLWASGYQGTATEDFAIDIDTDTYWQSQSGLPAWLLYKFPTESPVIITEFAVKIVNSDAACKPTDFKLQGSNDSISWTDLHTVVGESWASDGPKIYTFVNSTAYIYYRLYITSTTGGNYTKIKDWQLRLTSGGLDQMLYNSTAESLLPGMIHQNLFLDFAIDWEDWEDIP